MTFEALLDEAMRLPPQQRSSLANQLLESLQADEVDATTWEQTWTDELRQRLAHDDGQRFDLGQTLAELRANLGHGG
jgi:Arc/MetJ-type ribon-helix-helix transcriptional regulator